MNKIKTTQRSAVNERCLTYSISVFHCPTSSDTPQPRDLGYTLKFADKRDCHLTLYDRTEEQTMLHCCARSCMVLDAWSIRSSQTWTVHCSRSLSCRHETLPVDDTAVLGDFTTEPMRRDDGHSAKLDSPYCLPLSVSVRIGLGPTVMHV